MKHISILFVTALLMPCLASAIDYNPDIWLDASDASTITLAPGTNFVLQWSDKSGNGYHAIPPATTNRPVYDSIRGSIEFDGVDDGLLITNGSECGPNDEVTVFVVAQVDDISKTQSILTDEQWTTFCKRFAVHYWNVSFGGYMALYGDGRTEHANRNYDLHLMSFRYDGSILHSGMDGLTPPVQEAMLQDKTGSSDLMLGNAINFARNALDGRICEVIIYKKALTSLEMQDVEFQLRNKWGFEMDKTHPFYSDDFGIEFGQSFTVAENAANGTVIGMVSALSTNPAFTASAWRIEPQGSLDKTFDVGAFGIDPDSGEIYVADSSKLDYEQLTAHRIAVSMTDGTTRSRGVEVDIAVTDAADGDPAKTESQLWGANGELWDSYSRLPDWSYAGYHWGEDPIPDQAGWPVYNVTSYGAVADDGLDDHAAIQAAIDAVPASGGIVYMPAGTFTIEDLVYINRGNLILRGAGRDAGGTVLYCPVSQKDLGRSTLNDHIIEFEGNNGNYNTFNSKNVVGEAKRGDRTLLLSSAPGWQPGQKVHLSLTEEGPDLQGSLWLHLHNDQTDFNPEPSAWAGGSGTWPYTVERVSGKLVTFREPLRSDVRLVWQPKVMERKGMSEVGVEDFKVQFPVTPVPVHLQEDGYNAVHLKYVEHGWIRRLEFENADNPVAFSRSSNCTMEDLLFTGRAAHHGPSADYDGNNLIRNIVFDQTNSFIHSITFTHKAAGNVAYNLSGTSPVTLDLHGNCPMENLFTCVTTDWGEGSSGTAGSQPHGAHGNTYWNLSGTQVSELSDNYKYIGTTHVGPHAPQPDSHTITREWHEFIVAVSPTNIYDAQLARRLNPPADPAFAAGAFGVRTNWFERDPARWQVDDTDPAAYRLRNGVEAPPMPNGRLSEYSIYTHTAETQIAFDMRSLENSIYEPGAEHALVLGYQDDENYLYASVGATNGARIVRVQNGSATVLAADASMLLASNDWKNISFVRSGNTVELTYNGGTLQATDTVFTGGYAGVGTLVGRMAFREVVPQNLIPVADALATNVLEDASVAIVLTGSDPEGSNLTYSVATQPSNGTLSGTAPNLTYTPDTNYFGSDSFTFTVDDGETNSPPATVSITVEPANDAPLFAADPIIGSPAMQDAAYAASLAATDVDGDSLTYGKTGGPAWLTVATDGTLGGTPDSADIGLNAFTVQVDDGHGESDSAALQVNVLMKTTETVVTDLEFDFAETNSWTATGTQIRALRPVGHPGSNQVWNVGDTVTIEFDVTVNASTDPVDYANNSMNIGFGLGDGAEAICWGLRHEGATYQFGNISIDTTAGSAGSMSANLWSSGDRERLTGIEGTPYDLYDNNETVHMILSATYNGGTEYALAWTLVNAADTNNNLTITRVRDEGVVVNTLDRFMLRRNLNSGTADFAFANVVVRVEREEVAYVADSDGDGLTDAQEVALGTDPNDPSSGFSMTPLPTIGKMRFSWPSSTGVLYRIWESPDLVNWAVVRGWTNALTPPSDAVELDLSPSNGFFKVEADIQ